MPYFLGIQIDTGDGELHYPDEKFLQLKTLLQEWENEEGGVTN